MKNALNYERFYKHPQERIWKALTDSGWLAAWYMPNDFKPVVGHKFQFQTEPAPGFDGILYCEVLAADAPYRLSYTFRGGWMGRETIVTWTLKEQDGGTLVQLHHTGFSQLSDAAIRDILDQGWERFLQRLPDTLDVMAQSATQSTNP
jgi:uncharacterized protein YndB with AHSA1/START domain